MLLEEKYMQRCIQLAQCAKGRVSPNPLVGAVLVHNDRIIGEGYHQTCGSSHAEVYAINAVKDETLLSEATLYVNLEPCSHYGKTPPCAELIIRKKIPRVIIGMQDPYPKVAGRGIQMLQDAGIDVFVGYMQKECEELNKRFLTFLHKKRPYIILKWAQSADGFMDKNRSVGDGQEAVKFSSGITRMLMHKQRAEEDAILVGTQTALLDNPWLTTRHWKGRDPLRIAIDRNNIIPKEHHLKDGSSPTLIWEGGHKTSYQENIMTLLETLYSQDIQSIIVEGGATLLNSFIESRLWDEANVETCSFSLDSGVKAPLITGRLRQLKSFNNSVISVYNNTDLP